MAGINMCERCDSLVTSNAAGKVGIVENYQDPGRRHDLCPPCVGDLVAWMAEKPVREQRAYREPYNGAQAAIESGDKA